MNNKILTVSVKPFPPNTQYHIILGQESLL